MGMTYDGTNADITKDIIGCAIEVHKTLFAAQCLTYLRLTGLKTGLVINFGLERLIDGIERVSNESR